MMGPGIHYCSDSKSYRHFSTESLLPLKPRKQQMWAGNKSKSKQHEANETQGEAAPAGRWFGRRDRGLGKPRRKAAWALAGPCSHSASPVLRADGGTRFLRFHIHCSAFITRSHCLSQTEMKLVWNGFLFPQSSWFLTDR